MKIKSKGFGLIEIIFIIAVLLIMVFGFINLKGDKSPKNQVEQGNADIEAAKNAAQQENQDSINLQNQVNGNSDLSPNTYHNIENSAKNLPKQ